MNNILRINKLCSLETDKASTIATQYFSRSLLLLSEEFSSRVAESTRLILVKDGFGGDLGALDRRTDERRKATEI
jgi:hypothetical protein